MNRSITEPVGGASAEPGASLRGFPLHVDTSPRLVSSPRRTSQQSMASQGGRRNSGTSIMLESIDSPKFARRVSGESDDYAFYKTCRDADAMKERRKSWTQTASNLGEITEQPYSPPVKAEDPRVINEVKDLIDALDKKLEKLLKVWSDEHFVLAKIAKTVSTLPAQGIPSPGRDREKKNTCPAEDRRTSSTSLRLAQAQDESPRSQRSSTNNGVRCSLTTERCSLTSELVPCNVVPCTPSAPEPNLSPDSSFGAETVVAALPAAAFTNGVGHSSSRQGSKQSALTTVYDDKESPSRRSQGSVRRSSKQRFGDGELMRDILERPNFFENDSNTCEPPMSPMSYLHHRRPSLRSAPSVCSKASETSRVSSVGFRMTGKQWGASVYYLMEEPESSKHGWIYVSLINVLLIASSFLTFSSLVHMWASDSAPYFILETTIDSVFTIEVLVRFITCPNHVVFFIEYYNYVDMFAGLPPLALRSVSYALRGNVDDDTIDNILLGVVPVLRYLKLLRRFEKFNLLLKAFKLTFDALPVLLFTLTILILGFAAILFLVEPRDNIQTLAVSWYAVTMTLTTVGYGDVYPVSAAGQATMGLLSVLSTLYLAIPVGIVGSAFSCVWNDRDRVLLVKRIRTRLREMGLSANDIPVLFRYFDENRDGLLSIKEFSHMVSQLEVNLSLQRITELFKLLDHDGSGSIDDEEFVSAVFPEAHDLIYGQNDEDDDDDDNDDDSS